MVEHVLTRVRTMRRVANIPTPTEIAELPRPSAVRIQRDTLPFETTFPREIQQEIYHQMFSDTASVRDVVEIMRDVAPASKFQRTLLNTAINAALKRLNTAKQEFSECNYEGCLTEYPEFRRCRNIKELSAGLQRARFPPVSVCHDLTVEQIERLHPDYEWNAIVWNCSCVRIRFDLLHMRDGVPRAWTFKTFLNHPHFTLRDLMRVVLDFYSQNFTKNELEWLVNEIMEKRRRHVDTGEPEPLSHVKQGFAYLPKLAALFDEPGTFPPEPLRHDAFLCACTLRGLEIIDPESQRCRSINPRDEEFDLQQRSTLAVLLGPEPDQ
jgi:hypothetical protein